MTSLGELLREDAVRAETQPIPIRSEIKERAETAPSSLPTQVGPPSSALHDEQIHALVHELFLGRQAGLVRNVGFTPVESQADVAPLCLNVARTLAIFGQRDIGLIDTSFDTPVLEEQLKIEAPVGEGDAWPVQPRLWLVPRRNWWPGAAVRQPITDQNLDRLRELMTEFDFSVLRCGPASWMTARIASACDGLVLVLTANKTRRLVAAQIKDRFEKSHIPVLGSVLVERRFPVPQGLYRSL